MTYSSILKKGQVTLLVLLLGMLGLTVALAAASRSLQDINQTSQTDQGTQALAGAEAALQYGVAHYDPSLTYTNCSSATYSSTGTTFPGFSSPVQYKICQTSVSNSAQYLALPKDEVFQVNIPSTLPGGITLAGTDYFNVYWKNSSAVEVSVVYQAAGGNLSLKRFAMNGFGFTPPTANNFATATNSCSVCGSMTGYSSCFNNSTIPAIDTTNANAPAKLLRVRRLYASGDVGVCAVRSGTTEMNLGIGNLVVYGLGTTKSGTTRRVQANLSTPALPAVFDYALFTEGFLNK